MASVPIYGPKNERALGLPRKTRWAQIHAPITAAKGSLSLLALVSFGLKATRGMNPFVNILAVQ
jgi:hypothetical protein